MAWTCTPDIVTDDATGDQVAGFTVSADRQGVLDNKGQVVGMEADYYENEYGEVHHHFEDVELSEDFDEDQYNDDSYVAALHESMPGLSEAVAWCADGFTADEADWYNEMIDSGDIDALNEAVEYLMDRWMESNNIDAEQYWADFDAAEDAKDAEYEEEDAVDDWTEEQRSELIEVSDSLMATEPGGTEVAEHWQDFCDSASAAGDDVLAGVAAATACFHDGEITAEEAINYVITNFPAKEVERAWKYLNG